MTDSVKTLRKEIERAGRKKEPWHPWPPASAVLHHQEALQNLWNLWKWECKNVGDVSNLTIVQSLFLSFQKPAAITRTVWSWLNLALHTGVQTGTSEKPVRVQLHQAISPQTYSQQKHWHTQGKMTSCKTSDLCVLIVCSFQKARCLCVRETGTESQKHRNGKEQ